MGVSENLHTVEQCLRANGVDPKAVTILAVTKGQPAEKIQEAWDLGIRNFGVNYVQEGEAWLEKWPAASWHIIGQIQSRKVRKLTEYQHVQTVERLEVAKELDQSYGE